MTPADYADIKELVWEDPKHPGHYYVAEVELAPPDATCNTYEFVNRCDECGDLTGECGCDDDCL